MLGHWRLLQLPQVTTAAVFTNAGAEELHFVVLMYTLLNKQGTLYMPPNKSRLVAPTRNELLDKRVAEDII